MWFHLMDAAQHFDPRVRPASPPHSPLAPTEQQTLPEGGGSSAHDGPRRGEKRLGPCPPGGQDRDWRPRCVFPEERSQRPFACRSLLPAVTPAGAPSAEAGLSPSTSPGTSSGTQMNSCPGERRQPHTLRCRVRTGAQDSTPRGPLPELLASGASLPGTMVLASLPG